VDSRADLSDRPTNLIKAAAQRSVSTTTFQR
jgi:hypothetical protein